MERSHRSRELKGNDKKDQQVKDKILTINHHNH